MYRLQKTVADKVRCIGVGLHSGKKVNLVIKPAIENHGIRFVRVDLPNQPEISAIFQKVVDTSLATVIGNDGAIVSTIEHLMSTFAGLEIDNALVEMNSYEVPIMDGSAYPFTKMILDVGIVEQEDPKIYFVVKEPISLSENGKSVYLEPADKLTITCSIDFDHPLLRNQNFSTEINQETFVDEIAGARTFGFIHELDLMRKFGLAKGGSLDNAIVIDKDSVLNEDGLRFENEFVRHKILDSIGDFSLLGMPLMGHLTINKSGHAFHHAFLNEFFNNKKYWETKALLK